jgi:hypothetical protein
LLKIWIFSYTVATFEAQKLNLSAFKIGVNNLIFKLRQTNRAKTLLLWLYVDVTEMSSLQRPINNNFSRQRDNMIIIIMQASEREDAQHLSDKQTQPAVERATRHPCGIMRAGTH